MNIRFAIPLALAAGLVLAGSGAEARDGCGPGFHRGFYGWCRPNLGYRPFAYRYGYGPWGGPRWRYAYHRRWHGGGYGWGGFRHAHWRGGRGWGWHRRW